MEMPAMRTEFIEHFPLEELKPADYNPRKLDEDKFLLLQESLRRFGIIKPVIVNGDNGILTAGHQRSRAMKAIGMTHCPAIRIKGITRSDEINFNLLHNSIETNKTPVRVDVKSTAQVPDSYQFIPHSAVSYERNKNALIIKNLGDLITRYGEWGSIVCSEDGRVLLNSDYAVASQQNRCGMICYMLPKEREREMMRYLGYDYGQYFYDALGVKSYNQLHCQMNRLQGKKKRKITSTLYENYVIPELNKKAKTLDFGAGHCAYVKLLASEGYDICAYEPHFQVSRKLNVREVVRQINHITRKIKKDGLFDTVILDSVLNSVINSYHEHAVMTTCNALLRKGGTIYIGTRNLGFQEHLNNSKIFTTEIRGIEFLDKKNFTATFRSGVWTMQHFHSKKTLEALLRQYFAKVQVTGERSGSQIYAVASEPLPLPREQVAKALTTEFNMEYPNGYKHNRHEEIVSTLMDFHDIISI